MALLATMRSCQSRLALLISGQCASAMAGDPLSWQPPEEEKRELERFLQGLQAVSPALCAVVALLPPASLLTPRSGGGTGLTLWIKVPSLCRM
ncbi:MAG: hypothetical protein NTY67_01210 [Cyanobacteria bacterium]|nr:hypothetical protein [Cyanobacteriota bacterium]